MSGWRIEPLTAQHTRGLAECHIACWREAYADLVAPHVLAAFDVDRLAAQWERTRVRYPHSTHIALAENTVIGFARATRSEDSADTEAFSDTEGADDRPLAADFELTALYIRALWYGSGLADDLVDVVPGADTSCSLWVFEENPRAVAFYRKHGFELDGARRIEEFTPAFVVRMVRGARNRERS